MKSGFRKQAEKDLVEALKQRLDSGSCKKPDRYKGEFRMSFKMMWPFKFCFKGCGAPDAEAKKTKKNSARELIEAVVIALLLALFIRTFVIQAFKIPSSSMEDTLLVGDHLIVSKFAYGLAVPRFAMIDVFGLRLPFFDTTLSRTWGSVRRGDVIVFRFPGDRDKDYIKRVVGLPGDTVEIKDKVIYINGAKWDEHFGVYKGGAYGEPVAKSLNFGPITVPPDTVFVMGDNRDRSYDSRFWGYVPIKDIKGKAIILYWSWNSDAHWIRFGRLGNLIY